MVDRLGGSLFCATSVMIKQYVYEVSDVSLAPRIIFGRHLLEIAQEWAN
jgi:hypothetical protein